MNPLKKVNSIFKEIYKKYNVNSKYFFFLHLTVNKTDIDFNVSPDKRDVFIKNELAFYQALHQHLSDHIE